MAEASDKKGMIKQNLIDAGCDKEMVNFCISLAEQKSESELKKLLVQHKRDLLDSIHIRQKQVDCLDFLVYQIEKGNMI